MQFFLRSRDAADEQREHNFRIAARPAEFEAPKSDSELQQQEEMSEELTDLRKIKVTLERITPAACKYSSS